MMSETEKYSFHHHGLIKVTLPKACVALKKQFAQQLIAWLKHWMPELENDSSEISSLLTKAAQRDRQLVGKLYKVCRRFPSLKQLACSSDLIDVSANLMSTNMVSCCHFIAVRFDFPNEDSFLIHTHQDFPYIQGSENGVTVWTALSDISELMGPPEYVAASHLNGVLPISEKPLAETYGKDGGSTINMESNIFSKEDFVSQNVSFDEALVFSTLLVHRSRQNLSNDCRVSIQLRFDDLTSEKSYLKNYPEGLYLKNSFSESFPEYVVKGVDT